jgi:hypothetical protein
MIENDACGRPEAEVVIRAIALASGKLPGHEYFLTKSQMIQICRQWLKEDAAGRALATAALLACDRARG